jgi:hypothetical protein
MYVRKRLVRATRALDRQNARPRHTVTLTAPTVLVQTSCLIATRCLLWMSAGLGLVLYCNLRSIDQYLLSTAELQQLLRYSNNHDNRLEPNTGMDSAGVQNELMDRVDNTQLQRRVQAKDPAVVGLVVKTAGTTSQQQTERKQALGNADDVSFRQEQQQHFDEQSNAQAITKLLNESCRNLKSFHDVQRCYGKAARQLPDGCTTIETHDHVQQCLVGRYNRDSGITEIHILGERNSGTKFLVEELQGCFPRSATFKKVHRDFLRSKHFFQPIDRSSRNRADTFRSSLIVLIVRDPVDWMAAMLDRPYHSPAHVAEFANNSKAVPLPWREFVQKPWTTDRPEWDRELARNETVRDQPVCRQGFRQSEIVPCLAYFPDNPWKIPKALWRGYAPLYEMNRTSQEPYDHALQMRSDKTVNWLMEVPLVLDVGGFVLVRYEDLLRNGTSSLIEQVARLVGVPNPIDHEPRCQPQGPQPERIGQRTIPDDFREWIAQNLDPATESLYGYI